MEVYAGRHIPCAFQSLLRRVEVWQGDTGTLLRGIAEEPVWREDCGADWEGKCSHSTKTKADKYCRVSVQICRAQQIPSKEIKSKAHCVGWQKGQSLLGSLHGQLTKQVEAHKAMVYLPVAPRNTKTQELTTVRLLLRMNYNYISFQLFITGILPSSSPATLEAACPTGPWGTRGRRGWSSGLVPRPGCLPTVRLCGMWAQTVPSLPAMSLLLLTLTPSASLLCRSTRWQGTLHGEREQSKPRHSTEWHQLVRSPPPLAESPAKKAASYREAPPRKSRSHGCLWPRRQHIIDPHSVLSIPATTPLLSERFFLLVSCWGGFFTQVSKTTRTNIGTLPSLTSKFKYLRLDNDTDFFNFFFPLKNCCGFAATLRIVICIVWFWTYPSFDGGKG